MPKSYKKQLDAIKFIESHLEELNNMVSILDKEMKETKHASKIPSLLISLTMLDVVKSLIIEPETVKLSFQKHLDLLKEGPKVEAPTTKTYIELH